MHIIMRSQPQGMNERRLLAINRSFEKWFPLQGIKESRLFFLSQTQSANHRDKLCCHTMLKHSIMLLF
ncbi:MAG TPA: hypothetical protein DFK19_14435 [Ochrobactrum sp.]|nr:hypothetical protein [Ochrobactrum sp.]